MPNRNLTPAELAEANKLLAEIRSRLIALTGDDAALLFAYRRKISKELVYDERRKPMIRRALKVKKRKAQNGLCPCCGEPLPASYCVLDRLDAAGGYTEANTRLICEPCDRRIQKERAFK
jgi:hypothetical protein